MGNGALASWPAHVIVTHGRQQAAVQDADLLTKYPPDNKQRFDQKIQVGKDSRQAP